MNEVIEFLAQLWYFMHGTAAIIGALFLATALYEDRQGTLPRPAIRESYLDEDDATLSS